MMDSCRRQRRLKEEGISIERIEKMALSYLTDMQNNQLTLKEAKMVAEEMAHMLTESETYRPETRLSDILIRKN